MLFWTEPFPPPSQTLVHVCFSLRKDLQCPCVKRRSNFVHDHMLLNLFLRDGSANFLSVRDYSTTMMHVWYGIFQHNHNFMHKLGMQTLLQHFTTMQFCCCVILSIQLFKSLCIYLQQCFAAVGGSINQIALKIEVRTTPHCTIKLQYAECTLQLYFKFKL